MVININDETFFYQETAKTIVDSILELFNRGIKRVAAELNDFHDRITNLQYMPTFSKPCSNIYYRYFLRIFNIFAHITK